MSSKDKEEKETILDFLYSRAREDDWLEGIDLHEMGKVESVTQYEGLFSAQVLSFSGKPHEVRLRIRQQGAHSILQWTECSCPKNRKHSQYCEHIIGFILSLKKTHAELLENLNIVSSTSHEKSKPIQKGIFALLAKNDESSPKESKLSASQSLLKRLKSEIIGVSHKRDGSFELKIEDSLKTASFHRVTLDTLGHYLKAHEGKLPASFKTKNFHISLEPILLGLKVSENKKGNIFLEKSFSPYQEEGEILANPQSEAFDKNCYFGDHYLYHEKKGFFPLYPKRKKSKTFDSLPIKKELSEDAIPLFFEKDLEHYQKTFPVWIDEDLKKKHLVKDVKLETLGNVTEGEKGWFYLDPTYLMGENKVSMTTLIEAFHKERKKYLRTEQGWVKIPSLIKDTKWALSKKGEDLSLSINKLGLLRLEALAGKFDALVGSKKALLANEFEKKKDIHLLDAKETTLKLRPYQNDGLEWLCWLYNNRLHGLLADDMGLGKTHQAMGLLELIQKKKAEEGKPARFLIICPTTVLDHWHNKLQTFSPKLNPQKYHGLKRGSFQGEGALITSYGVILRDIRKLAEQPWDVIILDEAHHIKNNKTMTYKAVCMIESQFRLCLTGTPMENHLGELKNIFDFLVPGYLGSNEFFQQEFLAPISQEHDLEKEHFLQKLLYPLKLRRTKSEVLKDLPKKFEDIRYCSLSKEQSALYQTTLKQRVRPLIEKIKENEKVPYLHIFTLLQLLKQICNHPALIHKDENYENYESGKFDLLKDLLEEAIESGQKVVIFTQYLGMNRFLERYCKKSGIPCVSLTGATQNRGKVVAKFQEDPKIKVFIGSLLAGGMGIDLTAASVVIHYDRWWNPSKENQATDRVHRIGQKNSVQVFKLITKGTLEEKIDDLIKKKAEDFNKFFAQDRTLLRSFSKEDIIKLLD